VFLRISTLLSLVLAAGLIAAGCGDDDEETTTAATTTTTQAGATGPTGASGEPLSKAEFIEEADAICKAGDKEIDAAADQLFSGGANPGQAEEEAFITQTLVPGVQQQVDGIRALTPPEGDEEEVQAILDAAQQAIDELEADPEAFFEQGGDPFAEANQLAQEYGLQVCGQG
jgi:hypothetical protein